MGVEVIGLGSLPDELNNAWPAGGDPKSEGDDHIRNIKTTLKNFYQLWVAADAETRLTALESYVISGDASTLNGQPGSYYLNASNLNAGTVDPARLTGTYAIDISGTAANATNAATATNALTAASATLADDSSALGGVAAATVLSGLAGWNVVSKTNAAVQNFAGSAWRTIYSGTIDITDERFCMMQFLVNLSNSVATSPGSGYTIFRYKFQMLINGIVVWTGKMLSFSSGTYLSGWPVADTTYAAWGTAINSPAVTLPQFERSYYGMSLTGAMAPFSKIALPTGAALTLELQMGYDLEYSQGLGLTHTGWQVDNVEIHFTGKGVA